MKKPRNRFSYMFVGILIGFLVAWSIVWWQGRSAGNWHFFKDVKHYISNLFSSKDKDEDIMVITEPATKNNISKKTDPLLIAEMKNDSAYYDSTNFDFSNPEALDEFLAMYNGQLPDSSLFDSILKSQKNIDINTYENTAADIHVKKDKLIYAKSFTIPGIEFLFSDNTEKLDSLLAENSSDTKNNDDILHVEFWKSPINYKGYKTGKNKLVIFGIDQYSMISFKILNKTLYMKYLSDYYEIDRTLDFKSLIPLNNNNLVSQLNSQ
jgi:hypothetical protein